MQKEQISLLKEIALKVLQDAHKFPSYQKNTIYSSDKYPDFIITAQNKTLDDTNTKFNIWFVYNLVTPFGSFQPSIKFRYTVGSGIRLMSNYIKHFDLNAILPIYSYIIEKYKL